jgi:ribonucleoside-diphosphate reductase alpha chain
MMSSASSAANFTGISSTDATPEPEGPVCMLRPGDDGFEECEACQ